MPSTGRPVTTGRGRKTRVRIDVYLSPEEAERMDVVRGEQPRGAWLREVALQRIQGALNTKTVVEQMDGR